MEKKENEDRIVTDILKNLVDKVNSYVNSEEFSTHILQETPHLNTFSKTRIDGEIQTRMTKVFTQWLNKKFDNILQGNTDVNEKMMNVFQNSEGASAFVNDRVLGLQGAVLTAASGFAWAGYSAAFVGPLLPGVLTGLGLCKAVSVGIKYVSNILPEADAIINNSFKIRVNSVNKESLKTFFVQQYDNHLRKLYQDIFKEHLPAVEKKFIFASEEMNKVANRLDEEHKVNKEMLRRMCKFQKKVVKLLVEVETKLTEV